MLKLGVVGRKIGYSQSPFIHSAFGHMFSLAVDYTIQDVGEATFKEKIQLLRDDGFAGCNITVPFKEDALAMADQASVWAREAGAANTFSFKPDGSILADNTDGRGLVRDITENLNYSLKDKRILICGAGGAVRGILAPLQAQGPQELVIANRSTKPDLNTTDYAALAGKTFDLVIDGTSLKTEALPLPDSLRLGKEALVYDLKYGAPSFILDWGRKQGVQVSDGLGMLVEQAAFAFEVWTGQLPETRSVLLKLRERLCA